MGEPDVKDALEVAYTLFDKHEDGVLTFEDLKKVATELREEMTDEELMEMLIGASNAN